MISKAIAGYNSGNPATKPKGGNLVATFVFDTHQALQNLKEAGISEAQAAAMVAMVGSALGEGVATKADVQRVEQIVERVEQKLEYEIRSVRSDLQAMEQRIMLKQGGLLFAGLGLLFAALRFIP